MQMNVVEISTFGEPEVLRLATRPRPTPGPGEVLLRVTASGVNRPDVLQRKGHYPAPAGASDIPGLEVAGIIEAGDPTALSEEGWSVGDRVCALVAGGGYAEYCVVPVVQCLPIPKDLSDIEAASLPEACFTVWSNVFDRGHLQPGEHLLVHGGSSGIGVMAIQMAKLWGAKVAVTVGTQDKAEACRSLGADLAILYPSQDFVQEVHDWTQGQGVNLVLDMVAGDYLGRNLSCLADDGRLVVIAVQGGSKAQIDAAALMVRRLTLTGSTLRARSVSFKAAVARSLRRMVWPWIESERVKPVVFRHYPAAEAAEAHRLMDSHQHIGKLVLTW